MNIPIRSLNYDVLKSSPGFCVTSVSNANTSGLMLVQHREPNKNILISKDKPVFYDTFY